MPRRRRMKPRCILTQKPLMTWERGRLRLEFDNFDDAVVQSYARVEQFVDAEDESREVAPPIRTVVVEWADGRVTEYRIGRLRRYNGTNRRRGLRGVLSSAPVGPARTALGVTRARR